MDSKIKFAVVFHYISDTHLTKDPLLIPITMLSMGVESIVFVHKSEVTRITGVPRIITIDEYPTPPSNKGPMAYFRYIWGELAYARQLSRAVSAEKPDAMMFYYDPITACIMRILHPRVKIAFKLDIGDVSDIDKYPYPKILLKGALWLKSVISDILIIETQLGYDGVIKFAPFVKKKLRLIRNGIAPGFFLKPNEKADRKKTILSVARINRVKGLDVLVKGFAKVYAKHKDWKLKIIGPIEDQQYYDELKAMTVELALGKSVEFVTTFLHEDKHRQEFLSASIFCLSSNKEGAPAARVEAMAMGVPIVTTATGGSEMVEGLGIVVPVGDVDALAGALEAFVSDPKRRQEASNKEISAANGMSADKSAKAVLTALGINTDGLKMD